MTLRDDPSFARARSRLYELLAAVFDGDVSVTREAIEDEAFIDLAETFPVSFEADDLDRADLDEEALRVGYDNLFVVPGPHYVPPFASAHADDPSEEYESDSVYHEAGEAGELFGEPAEEISELHVRTDFEPDRGEGIPDHLAAEFEFMAALTAAEATALETSSDDSQDPGALRDLQGEVLTHLQWIDRFAEAVAENDVSERFYASLAEFASAYVSWDADQLGASAE